MPRRSSDMSLLLFILVLFSASIGFLHGTKTYSSSAEPTTVSTRAGDILSLQDALDTMEMVLASGNMNEAGAMLALSTMPEDLALSILENKSIHLSDEQKIRLLIAGISNQTQPTKRAVLTSYLAQFFPNRPIFAYDLEQSKVFIPVVAAWAHSEGKRRELDNWKERSIRFAIEQDNEPLLNRLYTNDIRPMSGQAGGLLTRVVEGNKDVAFVPFLVQHLGANPNYTADGKKTVLMKAVELDNSKMVKALLEAGADPDLILDPAVGSAVQIAFENGLVKIERLLRQN